MARPRLDPGTWGSTSAPAPFRVVSPARKPKPLVAVGRTYYWADDVVDGRPRPVTVGEDGVTIPAASSVTPTTWRVRGTYRTRTGQYVPVERWGASAAAARAAMRTAQAAAEQLLEGGHRTATGTIKAGMTVAELAEEYFRRQVEDGSWKVGTRAQYRAAIDQRVIPKLGSLTLIEAENHPAVIEEALRPTSPGSRLHARAVLVGAFKLARRLKAVTVDPMRVVEVPGNATSPPVALTVDEVLGLRAHLIAYCAYRRPTGGTPRSAYLPDLLDMMIGGGGLRPSETIGLRWVDVNFEAGTITVEGTVVGAAHVPLMWQDSPKTESSKRTIPVPRWCLDMLLRRRLEATSPWVFSNRDGGILWPANVGRSWRAAIKGTPFEGTARKVMRSTVATAVSDILGAQVAQRTAGHSRQSTTETSYIAKRQLAPDATSVLDGFGTPSDGGGAPAQRRG